MRIPVVNTLEPPADEYITNYNELRAMVEAMIAEGREDEIDPVWIEILDGVVETAILSEGIRSVELRHPGHPDQSVHGGGKGGGNARDAGFLTLFADKSWGEAPRGKKKKELKKLMKEQAKGSPKFGIKLSKKEAKLMAGVVWRDAGRDRPGVGTPEAVRRDDRGGLGQPGRDGAGRRGASGHGAEQSRLRSLHMHRPARAGNYAPWRTRGGDMHDVSDRATRTQPEIRSFTVEDLEMRETGKVITFDGVASVVGVPYGVRDQFGEYEETIAPGAFHRTIEQRDDIRLLKNHDPSAVFARTKSGTLELSSDPHLRAFAPSLDPANPAVQTLRSELSRGDIDQMSIGFRVKDQEWSDDYSTRTIKELALQEVSIVAFPASLTTSASVRSLDELALTFLGPEVDPDEIRRVIAMLETRLPATAGAITPQLALMELLNRKI